MWCSHCSTKYPRNNGILLDRTPQKVHTFFQLTSRHFITHKYTLLFSPNNIIPPPGNPTFLHRAVHPLTALPPKQSSLCRKILEISLTKHTPTIPTNIRPFLGEREPCTMAFAKYTNAEILAKFRWRGRKGCRKGICRMNRRREQVLWRTAGTCDA